MKKIAAILTALSISAITACSGSSSSSSETGYVDPGLDSVKQLIATKYYSVAGYTCPADEGCGAIIYTGTLSDTAYAGFAAGLDSANPSFSLKVYWPGSITDTTGVDTVYSGATVKINSSTYTGPVTLSIIKDTATANDSTTVTYYKITFRSNINVGGTYNIAIGDKVYAYKY